ncbi:TPA: CDGSH iron-sulfur domain-containing protein [Pseudomonas aeruginosa]|nr:CDGSH iron-sulfur domain-containing protein [Pseudomonas aeruginosa]
MAGDADSNSSPDLLLEVRRVSPGDTLRLCTCGASASLPDCPADCRNGLTLHATRERLLLLCRCGRSADLPYCDGSHAPSASGLKARWRRFRG